MNITPGECPHDRAACIFSFMWSGEIWEAISCAESPDLWGWNQIRGSIFGVEEIHTELYDASKERVTWVPDAFLPIFQADPDSTASAREGVNWLMSLWAGYDGVWEPETPEADKLTAGWIEEWLKTKQTGEQQ